MDTGILRAGGGQAVWVVGDHYTIKVSGEETGGAFALIEAVVPPGGGPPPHVHTREDEAFHVLEGELEFHADGRSFTAGPGDWVKLAKGSLHDFRNQGRAPARVLILVAPAGLERFFLEVGRAANPGDAPAPPTAEEVEKLVSTAPAYGLEIRPPS